MKRSRKHQIVAGIILVVVVLCMVITMIVPYLY